MKRLDIFRELNIQTKIFVPVIFILGLMALINIFSYLQMTKMGNEIATLEEQIALHQEIDGLISDPILQIERNRQSTILWTTILTIVGVVVGLIATVAITRHITHPLRAIVDIAKQVANGDLNVDIASTHRGDEVGMLENAFENLVIGLTEITMAANQISAGDLTIKVEPRSERDVLGHALTSMVTTLREQTQEMVDGVNILTASVGGIMAATSELTAGATQTAAAVSQTTTTVTQVRQTAQISSEKADMVSQSSRQTAEISQSGETATKDTIAKMQQINEQMKLVAESIVVFSEKSQTIGEIIATVNDLADQSNLLAVNASIEAALAGEQGKGFAVVAQEIRGLAEQSKQATTQVRTILRDIQEATRAAIITTEQGSKAVVSGLEQSANAGEAIRHLTESVTKGVQAATQIAASSREQLVGVDQMVKAMESIKLATAQNVDSSKQLESAAKNLEALGQKLKQLADRYQV